mgnify:CR=1 FL=1
MIESLMIEDLRMVRSPIETFGPMMELEISQPGAMLTGGIMMVFG